MSDEGPSSCFLACLGGGDNTAPWAPLQGHKLASTHQRPTCQQHHTMWRERRLSLQRCAWAENGMSPTPGQSLPTECQRGSQIPRDPRKEQETQSRAGPPGDGIPVTDDESPWGRPED